MDLETKQFEHNRNWFVDQKSKEKHAKWPFTKRSQNTFFLPKLEILYKDLVFDFYFVWKLIIW